MNMNIIHIHFGALLVSLASVQATARVAPWRSGPRIPDVDNMGSTGSPTWLDKLE